MSSKRVEGKFFDAIFPWNKNYALCTFLDTDDGEDADDPDDDDEDESDERLDNNNKDDLR